MRLAVQAYDGPIAMLPVAQLYVRDVPDLSPPEGKDLLQVLWCPFDHPIMPRTLLFWRSAAAVTDLLDIPPGPPAVQFDGYLPEPCVLEPEQITEYPDQLELSEELREQLKQWSVPQAAEEDMDPGTYYDCVLSNAPGWKLGGWPASNSTDPSPQPCSECGTRMEVLMTIATFEEGDDGGNSWSPHPHPGAGPYPGHRGYNATGVQIGSGYRHSVRLPGGARASAHRVVDFLPRLKAGDSGGCPLGFLLQRRLPRPGGFPLRSYTVSTGR
ncbi:hypothetical protein AB0G67_46760, partial [Streptomyces sp. NPDC021056]